MNKYVVYYKKKVLYIEKVKSAINVQINNKDKDKATNLKPSKELLMALEEGEQIIQDLENGKRHGYHNIDKLFEDLKC